MNAQAERNAEIVSAYRASTVSQGELAERYGVTRERIRQILRRDGGITAHTRQEADRCDAPTAATCRS